MKNEDVLALLENFPDLFDDDDLVEELAADLHPAASEAPAMLASSCSPQPTSCRDPLARRNDAKPGQFI